MVPSTATFVTNIPKTNIVIYDVSKMLLSHHKRKYGPRTRAIEQIYIHKTGADGPPGFRGYRACAYFCVNHRDWPGVPYHYWISRNPDLDSKTNMVIYQGQPEDVVSWHTGGANLWSLGIGIQGNYDGEWDLADGIPKIQRQPTEKQMILLAALVNHLTEKHGLTIPISTGRPTLSGHWEAPRPKAVCPGDALRKWVIQQRSSTPIINPPACNNGLLEKTAISDDRPQKWPVSDLQRALTFLGYCPGNIDGIFGYRTRTALEKFQQSHKMIADGWLGRRTALVLQKRLLRKGIHTIHALADLSY